MQFREMQESDLIYIQEHGVRDKDRKIRVGRSDYDYALVEGDVVLGVAGFRFINDTTAWCWLSMTDAAKQNLTESFRALSGWIGGFKGEGDQWIPGFCETMGIRRLEAYIEIGFDAGKRLVEHLGFEFESRKKNFFGDEPADCYVRFFKETK